MARKIKKNALGKGLKALIKDKPNSGGNTDGDIGDGHAKNMEFYGSLMKKYVRSGAEDELIEQMLDDVRSHMRISKREHKGLLETLRKRESGRVRKEEEQKKAQTEIKEELSQIYDRLQSRKGKKYRTKRFKEIEDRLDKETAGDSIALTNGSKRKKTRVKKVLRRRLVARNLDERAGIVDGPERTRKSNVHWSDDDNERTIMATAPKRGLKNGKEPIKAKRPVSTGEKEGEKPIELPSPKNDDVSQRADRTHELGSQNTSIKGEERAQRKKLDERSGPAIEVPPSEVPAGSGQGFQMKENLTDEGSKPEILVERPEGSRKSKVDTTTDLDIEEDRKESTSVDDIPTKDSEQNHELEQVETIHQDEDDEEDQEGEEMLDDSLLSMKMLMEENRIDEAYNMGERMLEDDPENVSVLNEMGVILYHKGMVDEALALYKGILEDEPESIETLINYATILSIKGHLDDSLACLDSAVRRDPYSEDAWNNKAVVLTRAGRLREALECLDEALRINEESVSTWMNAGIVLEKMGEIGPAMECYQNLLELDPDNQLAEEGIQYCRSILGSQQS